MTLSRHDTRIASASIVLEDPIPDVAFDLWLDTLIALRGPDILRVDASLKRSSRGDGSISFYLSDPAIDHGGFWMARA